MHSFTQYSSDFVNTACYICVFAMLVNLLHFFVQSQPGENPRQVGYTCLYTEVHLYSIFYASDLSYSTVELCMYRVVLVIKYHLKPSLAFTYTL